LFSSFTMDTLHIAWTIGMAVILFLAANRKK
jgi:hypothetical protein